MYVYAYMFVCTCGRLACIYNYLYVLIARYSILDLFGEIRTVAGDPDPARRQRASWSFSWSTSDLRQRPARWPSPVSWPPSHAVRWQGTAPQRPRQWLARRRAQQIQNQTSSTGSERAAVPGPSGERETSRLQPGLPQDPGYRPMQSDSGERRHGDRNGDSPGNVQIPQDIGRFAGVRWGCTLLRIAEASSYSIWYSYLSSLRIISCCLLYQIQFLFQSLF